MIYIDNNFICHTTNHDGSFRAFEVPFFDGKCSEFVEGYRYVPPGENWKRTDGVVFTGEMIAPWKDYLPLYAAQRSYEQKLLADYRAALTTLGVNV